MNERNDLARENTTEIATTALQPMSFVDILDGMFSLYRSHFRLFFGIIAVYLVFGFVLDHVAMYALMGSSPIASLMISILTSIVSYLISLLVAAGLIYASVQVYLGRDITSQAALKQGWRRFLPFLGSSILWGVVVGAFLFLPIISVLIGTLLSIHWSLNLLIVVVCVPFAIYFSVRLGLYTLPVLLEETTAVNALRRSTELVKGTWWRVFGIMLAISVIVFMIVFILLTSFIVLVMVTGAEDATLLETLTRLFVSTPDVTGWLLYSGRTLIILTIAGLIMPISTIGSVLLYFDLRIRKEALDIEMQVTD
ncbi:hypothetical protein J5I95_16730 [Candidatus Poribacteria bacterium]|nr:hypothetical protein [Candidatus Poribacteria bacterium]